MIDRTLIRYFLAVTDAGGFSRAAAQVGVSQPSLSTGIAKLETLLEARLFHRTNQRVELTEAGHLFLPHARRIESGFNEAQAALARERVARRIRLGVLASVPARRIAAILAAHRRSGAIDRLEIVEGSARDLRAGLERGRLDLALTLRRPGSRRPVVIAEGYRMMLPARHPLAREASIDGAALKDETMIVRRHCEALAETSRYFVARGVRPPFALRTRSDERALEMIARGIGITVMPASFRHPGVVGVPLDGFDPVRELVIEASDHACSELDGPLALLVTEAVRAGDGSDALG